MPPEQRLQRIDPATIRPIEQHAFPRTILAELHQNDRFYLSEDLRRPADMSAFHRLDYPDASTIFCGSYVSADTPEPEAPATWHILVSDIGTKGELQGFGIVDYQNQAMQRLLAAGPDGPTPSCGQTETFAPYRRRGLGVRRLLAMDAICQVVYGEAAPRLSASIPEFRTAAATRLWQQLEVAHLVIRTTLQTPEGGAMYQFL